MYHPSVISSRIDKLEKEFGISLKEHTVEECKEWCDRLHDAVDAKGRATRQLTPDEQSFIQNELLMVSASYAYWATRYCKINIEGRGVELMYPLLESQKFILNQIATLEQDRYQVDHADGILVNVLKAARQIGVSTLAASMNAHRMTTLNNIFGLVASDVPESSAYLFDMLERIVEHLPWWLVPPEINHVKNSEILFEGGSHIWVGAGKSTRGTTGQRGQLGRGKSLSVVHLSELSTWESPDQIDDALLPTMPRSPHTLAIFESTAKGRNNWWHKHWKHTREHASRFVNVFIPWFAEPKYSIPAPVDWVPRATTSEHAARCTEVSERWLGKKVVPTRDQLYWYETTREYYEGKDNLKQFLEEYGSVDDEECFQASGQSIFSAKVLDRIQAQMRVPVGLLEVSPMKELR